jgi:hypothetical protein
MKLEGRVAAMLVATLAALAALVSVGAPLLGPAAALAARTSGCGPASGTTLTAGRHARIYTLPGPFGQTRTYGCLFSSGRSWSLSPKSRFTRLDPETVVLRAPWVAYSEATNAVDNAVAAIFVRNLRTGRVAQRHPAVTEVSGPENFSSVAQIVLNDTGAVAWIGEENSITAGGLLLRQVEIGDSAGFSVADQGAGIEPRSLELHGSTLSWIDSGTVRSALLH